MFGKRVGLGEAVSHIKNISGEGGGTQLDRFRSKAESEIAESVVSFLAPLGWPSHPTPELHIIWFFKSTA